MYQKTEWKTGDVVSSEKLNKLEEGVANAEKELSGLPLLEFEIEQGQTSTVITPKFNINDMPEIVGDVLDTELPVSLKIQSFFNNKPYVRSGFAIISCFTQPSLKIYITLHDVSMYEQKITATRYTLTYENSEWTFNTANLA